MKDYMVGYEPIEEMHPIEKHRKSLLSYFFWR